MPLPPDLNKPVFTMFPEMADRILRNKCATCQQNISGMCQDCQDSIFQACEDGYEEENY